MTQMSPFEVAPAAGPEGTRTSVLVAGGLVAALALGAGGYFFLAGGSSDVESLPATPRKVTTAPTPAVKKAVTKPAVKKATVPLVTKVQLGRDPFRALYVVPVQAAAPTAATSTTTTGSTTTSGSTSPTATAANSPYGLKLVSVTGTSSAKFYAFVVDGEKQSVLAGQRFGKYGELIVLAYVKSSTGKIVGAIIQVGDDSPIDIAIGEKITVQ